MNEPSNPVNSGVLLATYRDKLGMPIIEEGHDQYIRTELKKFFPDQPLYFLTDYYPDGESKSPLRLVSFSNNWTTTYKPFPIPKFRHLQQIRRKEAYFVYEIFTESGQGYISHLYRSCKQLDIPTEQTIIVGSSYDYKRLSLECAKEYNVKPIKVFVYNFFERNMKRRLLLDECKLDDRTLTLEDLESRVELSNLNIPNPMKANDLDKKYLFLNHVPRPHRCAMLMLLHQQNLLDKGYISFHYEPPYVKDNERDQYWNKIFTFLKGHFNEPLVSMFQEGKNVLEKIPMKLDNINVSLNPAVMPHEDIVNYIRSSFFSLVSETFFSYHKRGFIYRNNHDHHLNSNQECRFLTEKTFKCFAYKHPFILITLPKTLEVLKELGYKTFHGIIDESYDQEEDDTRRFIKIINEVNRLCNLDEKTMRDYRKRLIPIVEHNFNNFINKKQYLKDLRYWGSTSVI